MSHFVTALSAGIIATVLVSGTAFMPAPAEAAKMSKADRVALKEATVACKAEARGKKVRWLARHKFVKCSQKSWSSDRSYSSHSQHKEASDTAL